MKFLMKNVMKIKVNNASCLSEFTCNRYNKACVKNFNSKGDFKNSCKNLMVCVPEKKGFGAKIIEK